MVHKNYINALNVLLVNFSQHGYVVVIDNFEHIKSNILYINLMFLLAELNKYLLSS